MNAQRSIDQALAWQQAGDRVILVTVVGVQGSSPREVGAQLWVTTRATAGSVGGGMLEHIAIQRARTWLDSNRQPPRLTSFPLGPDSRQCCGGIVVLLFEEPNADGLALLRDTVNAPSAAIKTELSTGTKRAASSLPVAACSLDDDLLIQSWQSSRASVALFGAGHVGTAIVHALSPLDFPVLWYDERLELLPHQRASNIRCGSPKDPAAMAQIPPGASWLIMTHRHDRDLELVRQAIVRADFGFLGLIGSATKRRRFQRHLTSEGFPPDRLDRLVCPIGIDGISGKEPAVIAASVVAQLLSIQPISDPAKARRSGISEKEALASTYFMALC